MLTEIQAQELMLKHIELREAATKTNDPEIIKQHKRHEQECISKFSYIVSMHTGRYKQFANYEDLEQEGYVALCSAMRTFDPKTNASFFFWAHRYIGTRISRCANLHTAIRFPLKIAREQVPKREYELPLLIEQVFCPDKQVECDELVQAVRNSLHTLRGRKKKMIALLFGFHGDKPYSINKLCDEFGISRSKCLKMITEAMAALKKSLAI